MLFGIVHVLGQDFSIGSCLLVIIAGTMVGVMFSMIAIESGSVWNSGIVHAIWNIVIIGGGLAIGEKMDPYSVMTYVLDSKVFAITGLLIFQGLHCFSSHRKYLLPSIWKSKFLVHHLMHQSLILNHRQVLKLL